MNTPAAHPPALGADARLVERARALLPDIAGAADEADRTRRLPGALLDALHDAQLFRMLLPRAQRGLEVDPITFAEVIETVATADASTAWCLSQAGGCAMAAAYLEPEVAQQIFGDPRAVLAWGPGPGAKAFVFDDGYRVTGAWSFASGCRHATWLGAQCPIYEADGKARLNERGAPVLRTMLVPASEVEWTDVWNVVGLRATGSDQFALKDHFVRHDHSITREFEKECRETGALYRMSSLTCYELGFAAVALGIARASLDLFTDLARNKVPRGMKSALRDNAVVQSSAAQSEAGVCAGRALLMQTAITFRIR